MEDYVTLQRFLDFTKPTISHMEAMSKNEKLLIAVKNRLLKAENEIKILKEEIGKRPVKNDDDEGKG